RGCCPRLRRRGARAAGESRRGRRSFRAWRCAPALARRLTWFAVIECRPQAARTWRGRRSERFFRQILRAPNYVPARGSDIADEPRKAHNARHGRLPLAICCGGGNLVDLDFRCKCGLSVIADAVPLLAPPERRALLLHQLDQRTRSRLVAHADRDRRPARRAHVGGAAQLPVLLADHAAAQGDLLAQALGPALLGELMPMTMRTQQPLRKRPRAATVAAPDRDTLAHSTRSRMAAAAVPP